MDWEDTFRKWGKPPGTTEHTKCENAETAVRKAITSDPTLSKHSVKVFAQGSYCNRTNVPEDSDVDICVLCTDSFFYKYPDGMTSEDVGAVAATYHYSEFKNDVAHALISYFGKEHVRRGKKAFDIRENTYRVDADAIACFEYRKYKTTGSYIAGTGFIPDGANGKTFNWPQQNYNNGVAKNKATGERFKAVVRILKSLKYQMVGKNIAVVEPIPSYLIECLTWNVPNEGFGHPTYSGDVRYTIAYLLNKTRKPESCQEWVEINQIKYLFHSTQPWTCEQVHAFLTAAGNYIGFK